MQRISTVMCLDMQLIIRTRQDVAEKEGAVGGAEAGPLARESLSAKNNDSPFRQLTETCPLSFTIIRHHDALGNKKCLVPDYMTVLLIIRQKVYRRANADIGGFAVPSLARGLSKVRWSVKLHASANYFLNKLSLCSLTQERFLQVSIPRSMETRRKIDAGRKCNCCVACTGIRGRSPECGTLLREITCTRQQNTYKLQLLAHLYKRGVQRLSYPI